MSLKPSDLAFSKGRASNLKGENDFSPQMPRCGTMTYIYLHESHKFMIGKYDHTWNIWELSDDQLKFLANAIFGLM